MIKKNRHRAGKRKRERILFAQRRAFEAAGPSAEVIRPVARVAPLIREPPPATNNPAVPLVDLTEEEAIPLINLDGEDVERHDEDLEILEVLPRVDENIQNLEPLDPEAEYHPNITRIFFTLDQYERSALNGLHPE